MIVGVIRWWIRVSGPMSFRFILHPPMAAPRLSRRAVDAQMIDAGTRLAVERTRLAYERTLMAWVRTATALISFGFTIYKFFEFEMTKHPVRASLFWDPADSQCS
jgi:Domain of unknown function (DUF202)